MEADIARALELFDAYYQQQLLYSELRQLFAITELY